MAMVVERQPDKYGQAMAEPAGSSIGAIGQKQAALAAQHTAAADADRVLTEALASAHAATVEGVRRLDAIAAEIDRAVTNQAALGLDTAVGAREFQKFLIDKQREIVAVVSDAREFDGAKKAVLEKLREHYTGSAG
jgi:Domain of unknown function (DUF4226)